MNKEVTVGVDIGGTNTVIGIVDSEGVCISKTTLKTTSYITIENFIEAIALTTKKLIAQLPENNVIKGMGIGAPNGNCKRRSIENAPNLKWKGNIPIGDILSEYFDFPILLTNDANAAAMGELVYGSGKGMNDIIVITLGTGLGSGFIAAGKLLCGHDGFAGELGHTIAVIDGRPCGCGRKGCLETYVSATGIRRTVIEMLDLSYKKSILRDCANDKITSYSIHEAAKQGDELALDAFEFTGKMLGIKLADTVAITNPQAIFLFGGLANAGSYIFEPTQRHMNANMLNIFQGSCVLLPSGIDENNAAILGAASLLWKSTIKNGTYLCPGHHI